MNESSRWILLAFIQGKMFQIWHYLQFFAICINWIYSNFICIHWFCAFIHFLCKKKKTLNHMALSFIFIFFQFKLPLRNEISLVIVNCHSETWFIFNVCTKIDIIPSSCFLELSYEILTLPNLVFPKYEIFIIRWKKLIFWHGLVENFCKMKGYIS